MASHSEIALVDSTEKPVAPKPRKTRMRRADTPKKAKRAPSRKTSKPAKEIQPAGTDIVPVMKLRAIDKVDDAKPENTGRGTAPAAREECPPTIQMPPPAFTSDMLTKTVEENAASGDANGSSTVPTDVNGEHLVTDPELLELLEQLSVTIDTANTVLDAAATIPAEQEEAELVKVEGPEQKPVPAPEPAPAPESETEDLPPLAARLAPESPPPPAPQKSVMGCGLLVNTALTGLVFAAGVAWVLHTNPWLLEGEKVASIAPAASVTIPDAKDQSSLQIKAPTAKPVAAAPKPVLASFSPPEDDPVPMETVSLPVPQPAAAPIKPARGQAGTPIALNISLPANLDGTEMSVMIQGVPDKATLSAGKNLGAGNWLLNEAQLDGVTLSTNKDFKPGNYELEVILVRSDGKVPETRKVSVAVGLETVGPVSLQNLAARSESEAKVDAVKSVAASEKTTYVKSGVAIQVAATPVSPAPDTALLTLTKQEVHTLMTRGDTLLREGDVAGARLLLEYAANSGNKQAMVKLGNSYDPKHLAKLGVRGVQPNESRAVHWYGRAAKSAAAQ